ncbi:hypothetical protein [Mucilaginibacter myungsuensis]|uniref:Uncharacterized protein n=1 Tax=Mucilaginibacter myungsuensis TaxID=649104 RepID=A0A929PXM9_9SPHI|nr:hypothetical protein [Mucilaginibacter myungsuensis]MBE9663319.1 hypothetical protein [Mucilaginibacter myungsuensis]MDN3600054.1 hypothetical protein [Mucilaginibacter myungsuensis]
MMYKIEHTLKTLTLITIISICFSCKKNGDSDGVTPPVTPPVVTPPKLPSGVYAVGEVPATVMGIQTKQTAIWKDTQMSLRSQFVSAEDVVIQDTVMYVSGINSKGLYGAACYWRNGGLTVLSDTHTYPTAATDIAVKGNDIYVVGYTQRGINLFGDAVYWKNGVMTKLDANGRDATATGVALIGDDVYISGYYNLVLPKQAPCYWKNGVFHALPHDAYTAVATELAVSGTDVYIIGCVSGAATAVSPPFSAEPVIWKNGVLTKLNTTLLNTVTSHVVVQGSDVYVSGLSYGGATGLYWKNGISTVIPNSANATCIAVQGDNVYVGGYYKKAGDAANIYAEIWKNGSPTLNTSTPSAIYDITIVP